MEIPKPFDAEEYPGQFRLRMSKSLHKLLAERSKQEGISMKMFMFFSVCLSILNVKVKVECVCKPKKVSVQNHCPARKKGKI